MKKAVIVMAFLLTLSIGYIVGTFSTGCSMAAKNWEYKVVKMDTGNPDEMTKKLNSLGTQGWEFCGSDMAYNHIFKK